MRRTIAPHPHTRVGVNRGEDRMPVVVYVRTRIHLGVRVSVLTVVLTSAHYRRVLQCWWSEVWG